MTNALQGAFDSFEHEHLPRTKYDTIVDETSNKPGEQAFEVGIQDSTNRIETNVLVQKLISGRYLGEILRLAVLVGSCTASHHHGFSCRQTDVTNSMT